ncbi:MAG TPA: 16S rRNA (guanine(527)-N(7))-methyltransferase RsmG [Chitinispirillaceae bacterium]|nr:16S rRNA (guanine(527)-N(7))-methyltransferase RsmG [Chitinispirillaceae bacterium]
MQKEKLIDFLKGAFPDNYQELLKSFETYYSWLVEENSKINLISRQTCLEDIWTQHILDSLLSIRYVNFSGKRILDFGTGGGFPGIPLAIVYPDSSVTLLDSRKKKIQALKSAVNVLGLQNCSFIDMRIEEVTAKLFNSFDIIVSRSVKMLPEFCKPLMNLLRKEGKLVLYKSRILDDVSLFESAQIFDASDALIGERKIVVIPKKSIAN